MVPMLMPYNNIILTCRGFPGRESLGECGA